MNQNYTYQVFPVSVLILHNHAENIGTQLNIFAILHAYVGHSNFDVMRLVFRLYLHLHALRARSAELLDLKFSHCKNQTRMVNVQ
jgi:hypothetical protein